MIFKQCSLILLSLIYGTFVYAECSTNRNSNIPITKPDSHYTNNGDGTITDKKTGLMWRQSLDGAKTWQAALAYANDYSGNGYSDWRIPNLNELFSLVETACFSPAINETMFPLAVPAWAVWSSSTAAERNDYAWYVSFQNGIANKSSKDGNRYVRLVRDSD